MEFERITLDPTKMRGVPCIRSLRIPVAAVLGQLAAGQTQAEILADFPDLEPEDIKAALEYAATAVQERPPPQPAFRDTSTYPAHEAAVPDSVLMADRG